MTGDHHHQNGSLLALIATLFLLGSSWAGIIADHWLHLLP